MTITSEVTKVSFSGDGSTAIFGTTPMIFWGLDDLKVILRDENVTPATETTWTRGTQFTLTGGDGAVGTLTVETTPTDYTPQTGEKLFIKSDMDDTQDDALPLGGDFPSTTVEEALDQNTRMIQQKEEQLLRSVKLAETSPLSNPVLPEPGAGQYLRWNMAGTELELGGTTVLDNGTFLQSGTGAVSRTIDSKLGDVLSVRDFGATGDGVTDDAAAIQLAIDAAETALGGEVFFPLGIYLVGSTLTVGASSVRLKGGGIGSIIRIDHNSDVLDLNKADTTKIFGLEIADLNFDCLTDRSAGAVIHVGNIGQSRFSNIRITNGSGGRLWDGIVVDAGSQCFYHHVRINGCANDGLTFGNPNVTSNVNVLDHTFTECQFDSNLGDGIVISNNSTTLSVEGIYGTRCSVFSNTGNGIRINASGATSPRTEYELLFRRHDTGYKRRQRSSC